MRAAVDTNFLLDLARPRDVAHDALEIICRRAPNLRLVVTPTVFEELGYIALEGDTGPERQVATLALQQMVRVWRIEPVTLTGVGRDIMESVGDKLRDGGIIPAEEKNDSYIVAEAALAGCDMLISSDAHLRNADRLRLALTLKECDVSVVIVCTPREIVLQFGGRRH
jgi:predicted nucleic acid-binding protein